MVTRIVPHLTGSSCCRHVLMMLLGTLLFICQTLHAQPNCDVFINKTTANGLLSDQVTSVSGSGNRLYVGTANGLAISTDGGNSFSVTLRGIYINDVYAYSSIVCVGTNNGLWISTDYGNNFYINKTVYDGLGGSRVNGVFIGLNAVGQLMIYAATTGGLSTCIYGNYAITNKTFNGNNVLGVYMTSDEVLFVGTFNATLFSPDGVYFSYSGPAASGFSASNGMVYAATTSGVAVFTGTSYSGTRTTANGLGSNTVYDVFALGNYVYAATAGGLSISTDGGNTFTNRTTSNGLGNNQVNAVVTINDRIYAGTQSGLSFCTTPSLGVSIGPGSITACTGTASVDTQTFSVSGTNLVGNVTVTAPTNFEVSTNASGGFSSSLTLTIPVGTISTLTNTTIYVRSAASARTGGGRVTVATTGASTQNVDVYGSILVLPVVSIAASPSGSVAPGTSVALTASGANNYQWNTGATANPLTVAPTTTTTYSVTGVKNGCVGTSSATVTVNPPSLALGAISGAISACSGTASVNTQTFSVSGANLLGSVTVTAPTNFEISTSAASGFGNSLTLTPTGTTLANTTIFVRSSSTASAGSPSGIVTVATTGVTTQDIVVWGTVTALPVVSIAASPSGSVAPGTSVALTASGATSYQWNTGSTANPLTVASTQTTTYSVTGTTNGCVGTSSATVTVNPPSIALGALTGTISACSGTASVNNQTFSVSGSNLVGNVTVTAPTNFEVSTSAGSGFGSSLTLTPTGTTLANTTIYVRSATSAPAGNLSGNVSVATAGVTTQNVAVSGTITALPVVSIAANPSGTVAPNTLVALTASGATSYQWSTGSTANPLTVAPTTTMTYSVTGTGSGCLGTATTTVTLGTVQLNTASSGSITACVGTASTQLRTINVSGAYLGGNLTVTAPANFQVSLSPNSGFGSSVVVVGTSVSLGSTPVYVRSAASAPVGVLTGNLQMTALTVTSTRTVSATVNALPTVAITANPATLVLSGTTSVTLTASGAAAYQWSANAGSATTAQIVATTADTYSVTGTSSGCQANASVAVTGALPVTLRYFNGRMTVQGALLNWATSRETDNAYFQIERSRDVRAFETIGLVPSQASRGTASATFSYTYTDTYPLPGIAYYRLVQVDTDGRRTASTIIALQAETNTPVFFPNPLGTDRRLHIEPPVACLGYRLYDNTGKLVLHNQQTEPLGLLMLPNLASGVYMLHIDAEDGGKVFRLLVP